MRTRGHHKPSVFATETRKNMKNDKTSTKGGHQHLDAEQLTQSHREPSDRPRPAWLERCPLSGVALTAMVAEIIG